MPYVWLLEFTDPKEGHCQMWSPTKKEIMERYHKLLREDDFDARRKHLYDIEHEFAYEGEWPWQHYREIDREFVGIKRVFIPSNRKDLARWLDLNFSRDNG